MELIKQMNSIDSAMSKYIEDPTALIQSIEKQSCDHIKLSLKSLHKIQTDILHKRERNYQNELDLLKQTQQNLLQKNVKEILTSSRKGREIPLFWKNAIINSGYFEVNKIDNLILNYLKIVDIDFPESIPKGFTIKFYFCKNEYFKEPILHKTYYFSEDMDMYDKCEATSISWKTESATRKIITRNVKNGKTKSCITIEKKLESFFNLFDHNSSSESDLQGTKEDEENDVLDQEASFFLNCLIPYSVEYYLGLKRQL